MLPEANRPSGISEIGNLKSEACECVCMCVCAVFLSNIRHAA